MFIENVLIMANILVGALCICLLGFWATKVCMLLFKCIDLLFQLVKMLHGLLNSLRDNVKPNADPQEDQKCDCQK